MPTQPQKKLELLVRKLALWSEELLRIRSRLLILDCAMADKGVISRREGPVVTPTDPLPLVRLKEESISLRRTRDKIHRQIEGEGASILVHETLEILFPGGPTKVSYLSWTPGELGFLHYRERADTESERKLLPNVQYDKAAIH